MSKLFTLAPIAAALMLGTAASAAEMQTTGTVGHYSPTSETVWISGEGVYHFRLNEDFPDLSNGDEIQLTYYVRDGVRYVTDFEDLS
ncbi:hypothetical protein ACXN5S_17430 [Pseudoroseicyclus sp. H15]